MTKLYITAIAVCIMACLIPIAPLMAVSVGSPFYTHFTYQFAHAGIMHWLINAWALLVLHNILSLPRLAVAYTVSVLITFSPLSSFLSPLTSHLSPLLGSSVITCFFFGFLAPYFWRKGEKLTASMMLALILVGFFIPGMAALPHLLMFLSGIAWFFIERLVANIRQFVQCP